MNSRLHPPIDKHSAPHLYPFALVPLGEFQKYVRAQCTEEEVARLPDLVKEWLAVQDSVAEFLAAESEAKVTDSNITEPLPEEFQPHLEAISNHPAFPKTFGMTRITFENVPIDNLIATQRSVNVEHMESLAGRLPENPQMEELIDFCLAPSHSLNHPQYLEAGPNSHVFSSSNCDLRFLGSFLKPIEPSDVAYANYGGIPTAVVISLVGFGISSANAFKIGNRLTLNNGFHRLCALRSRGISRAPLVVQHISNPQLELPAQVLGLPRDYIIRSPRPVLMKDLFDPRFTRTLKLKRRLKTVNINVGISQYDVPA